MRCRRPAGPPEDEKESPTPLFAPLRIKCSAVLNLRQCGFRTVPALHLDPLAFLEILVMLEKMLDALKLEVWHILNRLDLAIGRIELVHGYGQQLGISARFVFHPEHTNGAGTDDTTNLY